MIRCNKEQEWLRQVEERMQQKEPLILAMDGMSGAFKTTLAQKTAQRYGGVVIHCDDFFLPSYLRTSERMLKPGGNIHYERMKCEVIDQLPKHMPFVYQRFDCATMTMGDAIKIPKSRLYLIEGAYALHPYFGRYYDFSVYVCISAQEQEFRIQKRNSNYRDFFQKWIPMEQQYQDYFSVAAGADMVLDTTEWRKE